MQQDEAAAHRQQDLYLSEVFQLMVDREYMRRYRAILARRVAWFGAVRAVASSSAIAAWAIWQSVPMVWGGIIAVSQVADALKDVFPFAARHKAANEFVARLEALLIDALHEAEGVYAGRLTNNEINDRRRRLMTLRHDADTRYFPDGSLPDRQDLFALAEEAAMTYFNSVFGPGTKP